MYKSLLIFKYLRRRRIAWVSLIGVTLCTAMVLVVISVMGGWLEMFKAKFHGMTGDIVVYRGSVSGFAGYPRMIAEIEKLPEVRQAVPLINSFGLLNVDNNFTTAVQVKGIDLAAYSTFNDFRASLYRQYKEPIAEGKRPPATASFDLIPGRQYEQYRPADPLAARRPGMIIGAPLLPGAFPSKTDKPSDWVFDVWGRLEVVPMSSDRLSLRDVTPSANIYWVVDVSRTKVSFLDERALYVPFDVLQKDLKMDEQHVEEVVDGKTVQKTRPARCSEIQVALRPGADRAALLKKIDDIVQSISVQVDGVAAMLTPVNVEPWEQQYSTFLSAVENEKSLLTTLMGLISLVAIFLIFCILYMIVVEKTRDIGIIKSLGATSRGIASVFLGYGLAIGVVGGVLGLVAGVAVMWNINELHAIVAKILGKPIWDPEVYAFDKIPDTVDPTTAAIVVGVAILSAVIGAVVPAVRAARQNPIDALRYE